MLSGIMFRLPQGEELLSMSLTPSWAKPIITVHMLCKTNALQEKEASKQLTLNDQETTDQYVVDYKVLQL